MKELYTDNIQKISQLNLTYKLIELKDWKGKLNSLFLISSREFDVESISDYGFVITLFESDYSDFEILDFDKKLIANRLDYFYELCKNSIIEDKPIIEKKSKEKIKEVTLPNIRISKENLFKGIYINNILIKNGNIRFLPIYEVIVYIFKENFNGKLSITKKNNELYSLEFSNGELVDITSFIEDDNFQYFLKKYGYISKINKEIYLYSIEKQLDIFISNNSIFKHERSIIYKDYMSFLFRNIITISSGDFLIKDDFVKKKDPVFSDYLSFLYNFINYLKSKKLSFENFSLNEDLLSLKNYSFNQEISELLAEIKKGKSLTEIKLIFHKYEAKYLEAAILFLLNLGFIKKTDKDTVLKISSNNINENISQRITIWLEKIKKENYFSLLGVNINDNDNFIEDKFRNLFSQFSNYLSSKEVREMYKNDLEDIIFELESAYNVIKNKELKEEYYNKMLK